MTNKQFYTRRRLGLGFKYYWNGQPIKDRSEKKYFAGLGIPPAWKDVKISTSKRSRILATGMDKAGRMQYIYHPTFRARMEKEKFERILRFAEALPKLRRTTAEHLKQPGLSKEKVLACVVRLMDDAYFRVGNEIYAEENQSYGLTTLRRKHVQVKGHTIIFDFIGKSGQEQFKEVTNKKLAKIIRRLDDLPGYEIFKYYAEDGELKHVGSDDVNSYIKNIMGEEFSAKDFRTWGGTVLASAELAAMERPASESKRKKAVAACVKNVSEQLGNTPAITRQSYIDPRVINAFLNTNTLARVRETVERMDQKSYLSRDERLLLQLLQTA